MSASNYVISPLPLPPGPSPPTPVRQNLDLYPLPTERNDPSMMELYIEAMQIFMEMNDLDDELSYFRVAGQCSLVSNIITTDLCLIAIHGAPYVGWGKCNSPPTHPYGGNFCVHNNVTFPTFHRVYMMLFEVCIDVC
jgi:tyrosinase